jgi:uncharacterized protein
MSGYEVVREHYEAGKRGDIEGMLAPLAQDCRWKEMDGFPYRGTYIGPGGVLEGVFVQIGRDWDGFKVVIDELVDGGDTVVGVGTYSGTCKETGKEMEARVVHVWKLRGDQVVAFEQFTDTLRVAEAMQA